MAAAPLSQSLMAATPLSSLSFPSSSPSPGNGFRVKYPKLFTVSALNRISIEDLRLDPKVGVLLDTVKWDDEGLAVAISQNIDTGAILMQGFANRESLATTISSRKATFYYQDHSLKP